jgi:hypothetical protein
MSKFNQGDQNPRHIYMNVPNSGNLNTSWYGESVLDVWRTPHPEKLHVVERWHMTDGGNGAGIHDFSRRS